MKKFIDAMETLNYSEIHEAAKKEASRQVGEMTRWVEHKELTDPEALEALKPFVEAIEKSKKYRYSIYNRNKQVKLLKKRADAYFESHEYDKQAEVNAEIADAEAEQWTYCWRILKIYCVLLANVTLVEAVDVTEMYSEYEYEGEAK